MEDLPGDEFDVPDLPPPPKTFSTAGKGKWEKELVKRLEVTWGDAKAILQIAKDDLGIDQKDYPEEYKDEIFAKCDEVAESFEKTPLVNPIPKPDGPPKPSSAGGKWEKELVRYLDVTWADAQSILQIAKDDLGIDPNEFPEESKDEIFTKCEEVAENFPKHPLVNPRPEPDGPPKPTSVDGQWEKELVKRLEVTWADAQAILLIAKKDLDIDEEDFPEESKDEIFEKCDEVAETFEKHPLVLPYGEAEEEDDDPSLLLTLTPSSVGGKWETELSKRLKVTWGDAKAILQIAKNDLGIDQAEFPEESKDEIFAKCDEVAESFEKHPRVALSVHAHNPIVSHGGKPVLDQVVREDFTWEGEIKIQYSCSLNDATILLQMAKHELMIPETEYPEEQKKAVMARVATLAKVFEFTPVIEPAMLVFVRDPWADELSNELNCRISNAKQLLLLAKRDLGLPEDEPAPVSKKAAVFAKAREIAATYELTPKDKVGKPADSKLTIAIILLLIVAAIAIGVGVGVSNRDSDEDASPAPPPTDAPDVEPTDAPDVEPTDAPEVEPTEAPGVTPTDLPGTTPTEPPIGTVPSDCPQVLKDFDGVSLVLSMAVSSNITQIEIDYAASVFERTYMSLVTGVVEGAIDYCDPYCRNITDVAIASSEVVPAPGNSFEDEGCDSVLDLTFDVTGTFVGCEDTPFPGLFSTPPPPAVLPAKRGRALTSPVASFLRGGSIRWLQTDDEQLCASCPDSGTSLGNVVPTEDEMVEVLNPLLSVLPSICEVTDFVTADEGGEAGSGGNSTLSGGPPEGGWTPIDCASTLSTDNCPEFLAADSGTIPCSCDGQCIQYLNGVFLGCNDSGDIGGVSGEAVINAAGCTFADHAADVDGFTCLLTPTST